MSENEKASAFPSLETFEKFNDLTGHFDEYVAPSGGLTKLELLSAMFMHASISRGVPITGGLMPSVDFSIDCAELLLKRLASRSH